MERATVDVYERQAGAYDERRPAMHRPRAAELAQRCLPGRPVIDVGCGPGRYLDALGGPARAAVALDAAWAMLRLAGGVAPDALRVRADLEAPPFRDRSLGGAWARNVYLHLPREHLPMALAQLHWALAIGAPIVASLLQGDYEGPLAEDDFPGRFFVRWLPGPLTDTFVGAGFDVERLDAVGDAVFVTARRARTLPDTVGPGMRMLVCGLNPSLVAADAGFGYAGATNRFWGAALEAELISRPRDPLHALRDDHVGMTDLVKRATPRSGELSPAEYRVGAERVRRLVTRLRPAVVLFVGLEGWRGAVDRRAGPGPQSDGFAGAPAYVMPSSSGANARTSRAELVAHLRAAQALAG